MAVALSNWDRLDRLVGHIPLRSRMAIPNSAQLNHWLQPLSSGTMCSAPQKRAAP